MLDRLIGASSANHGNDSSTMIASRSIAMATDRPTIRRLLAVTLTLAPFAACAQEDATSEPLLIRIYPPGPRSRLDALYAYQNTAARRIIASVCTDCGVSLPNVTGAQTIYVSLPAPDEVASGR